MISSRFSIDKLPGLSIGKFKALAHTRLLKQPIALLTAKTTV